MTARSRLVVRRSLAVALVLIGLLAYPASAGYPAGQNPPPVSNGPAFGEASDEVRVVSGSLDPADEESDKDRGGMAPTGADVLRLVVAGVAAILVGLGVVRLARRRPDPA